MIVSGTHAYDWIMGNTNGTGIDHTEAQFAVKGLDSPALIELEVTKYLTYDEDGNARERFRQHDLSKLVSQAKEYALRGGVVSISAHFANPLGPDYYSKRFDRKRYTGEVGGDAGIEKMITEGTQLNKNLRLVMDATLRLAKALDDNGVPFLFRPFHEMNGSAFWWDTTGNYYEPISPETYADLWRYLYNVVTRELGITEALWTYAPSPGEDVLLQYPGDEYVDIVGIDWYGMGAEDPRYNKGNGWENLMSTGKPVALTEVGPDGSRTKKNADGGIYYDCTCRDLLADLKNMIANGHKIAFFETWTWLGSIAYLGNPNILMEDPIIYTLTDMMKYWENN